MYRTHVEIDHTVTQQILQEQYVYKTMKSNHSDLIINIHLQHLYMFINIHEKLSVLYDIYTIRYKYSFSADDT